MGKRIDRTAVTPRIGSGYPAIFAEPHRLRERLPLAEAAGLTRVGVNLLRLPPGAWSSQRHWHENSDEMIFVVAGEVVMVTNAGEEVMRAGDAAGFRAGDPDGHHLQNRSSEDALILEMGDRPDADTARYPDIDLIASRTADGRSIITRKDGTPY
jgi:uncharacterized cupin superfamily protein